MTHPAWEGRIALSTGPHQARTHLSQALTGFLSHSVQPKPTLGRQKNGGPGRDGPVQGYRARTGAQAFPGGAFSCMPGALPPGFSLATHMQFRAARSLCTNFCSARYSMPWATCRPKLMRSCTVGFWGWVGSTGGPIGEGRVAPCPAAAQAPPPPIHP